MTLRQLTPAEFDRIVADDPPRPWEPCVILLEHCPACGGWLPEHSRALGQCRECGAFLSFSEDS